MVGGHYLCFVLNLPDLIFGGICLGEVRTLKRQLQLVND